MNTKITKLPAEGYLPCGKKVRVDKILDDGFIVHDFFDIEYLENEGYPVGEWHDCFEYEGNIEYFVKNVFTEIPVSREEKIIDELEAQQTAIRKEMRTQEKEHKDNIEKIKNEIEEQKKLLEESRETYHKWVDSLGNKYRIISKISNFLDKKYQYHIQNKTEIVEIDCLEIDSWDMLQRYINDIDNLHTTRESAEESVSKYYMNKIEKAILEGYSFSELESLIGTALEKNMYLSEDMLKKLYEYLEINTKKELKKIEEQEKISNEKFSQMRKNATNSIKNLLAECTENINKEKTNE